MKQLSSNIPEHEEARRILSNCLLCHPSISSLEIQQCLSLLGICVGVQGFVLIHFCVLSFSLKSLEARHLSSSYVWGHCFSKVDTGETLILRVLDSAKKQSGRLQTG